jgi:hypothetical protein
MLFVAVPDVTTGDDAAAAAGLFVGTACVDVAGAGEAILSFFWSAIVNVLTTVFDGAPMIVACCEVWVLLTVEVTTRDPVLFPLLPMALSSSKTV